MNYKRLGNYIERISLKNTDGLAEKLYGINIDKFFMPSVANVIGTDLTRYKVVSKNQFACNRMHVGRDKRLPIALSDRDYDFIVSPAYDVFEINDIDTLLPEYLMMWFTREEFDRNCWFHTDSDVRGKLDWDAFMDMTLPIPSIEKQQQIVAEYNTVTNRIELNEKINTNLEATAQALYKHWFVDFEFPIDFCQSELVEDPNCHLEHVTSSTSPRAQSRGEKREVSLETLNKIDFAKGYKSSGGKMVYNEELDKEIPVGWSVERLVDISKIKGGKRMPSGSSLIKSKTNHTYIKVADLGKYKYVQFNDNFEFVPENVADKISRYITRKNDVIISIVGTIGVVKILGESLDGANLTENCMKITELRKISPSYLYHYLVSNEGKDEIQIRNVGAVQAKLPMYNIESFPIVIPKESVIKSFNLFVNNLDKRINIQIFQSQKLKDLQSLLLAKMTQGVAKTVGV